MAKSNISPYASLGHFDWRTIVSLCIKRRNYLKWSLQDLSNKSGVKKIALTAFENGMTNIKVSTIFKIITSLNISPNQSSDFTFLDWQAFVGASIQRRNEMAMSLDDIQNAASVSYKLIKKFESGEKNIGLNGVLKILRVLHLSRSRCFQKMPVRENFLSKRRQQYGTTETPGVLSHILEWEKIVELSVHIRHVLNLTQTNIANRAKVSRPIIVNFEGGRTNLKVSTIHKILNALDLNENLNALDLARYFKILNWESFVQVALDRKEELCLSRNELAKFSKLGFPIVTKFEEGNTNINLNSVIKILEKLGLMTKS